MSIVYSKIKKHIIGKNFFWGLCILFFLFLIWSYIMYLGRDFIFFLFNVGSILMWFISYLLIMGVSYGFINLYRCKRFYKFCDLFLLENDVQFCKIMIEKKDYEMKVPNRSYDATVRPLPESTNAIYFETNEFILLFFSVQHFVVLKNVLKPYIFLKTDKEFHIKDKSVKIVRNFETTETEQGRAIVFSNKQEIKRMIIPAGTDVHVGAHKAK